MIIRLASPLVALLLSSLLVSAKGSNPAAKESKKVSTPFVPGAVVSLRGTTEKTVPLRTHSLYARTSFRPVPSCSSAY